MDDGDRNFASLSSYRNFAFEHTVTFAADGVESGKVYSFRFNARNSKGWSEYSEQTLIAAVSAPQKAAKPIVDYTKSTSSSIFMSWQLNTDEPGAFEGRLIKGYKLYVDDGRGGDF
jgi:hypothetical protein